jgi:NADH dehydrogenase
VHLVYIIGFKHRITTLLHWIVTFIGRGRSERVVTEQQVFARQAIADLGGECAPQLPRLAKDRPHEAVAASVGEPTHSDPQGGEHHAPEARVPEPQVQGERGA